MRFFTLLFFVVAVVATGQAQDEKLDAQGHVLLSGSAQLAVFDNNPRYGASVGGYYFIHPNIGLGANGGWTRRVDNEDFGFGNSQKRTSTAAFVSPGLRFQKSLGQKVALFVEAHGSFNWNTDETITEFPGDRTTTTTKNQFYSASARPGVIYFPVRWLGLQARMQGISFQEDETGNLWNGSLSTDNWQLGVRIMLPVSRTAREK